MPISKKWVDAVNQLEAEGVAVTRCPECGELEFEVTELRRAEDPDFLLGKFYECRNCGAHGESRIAKRVQKPASNDGEQA